MSRPILLSLALWATALVAPGLAAPWPLEPLIDGAIARHPAMAAATASQHAAQARAGAAAAPYWPQVSANSSLSRTTNVSFAQTTAQPFTLGAAALTLRQQLWDFGKTATEVDAATAQVEALAADRQLQAAEVAFAVRTAYLDWLVAGAQADQAHARATAAGRVLAQAQAYVRAGKRAKIEVVRAEATAAEAKAAVVAARVAADQARRALVAALGAEPPSGAEPIMPSEPPLAARPLERLLDHALRAHPSLRSAGARTAVANARAEGAAKAGWPDLNADVNYGTRTRDNEPSQNWSAGVSFGLPLFTGFQQTRTAEATAADAQAARATEADRARTVRLGVERAHLALTGARERLPSARALLASARETYRLAEGRYRAGVGSLVELADAQALFAGAEAGAVRAEADVHRAIADLWRALGATGHGDAQAGS